MQSTLRDATEWEAYLNSPDGENELELLYQGDLERQKTRCLKAIKMYGEAFSERPLALISMPGRVEICGNHTDHQGGRVIAAAITLDKLAAVAPTSERRIRVLSEGFSINEVDISDISRLRPKHTENDSSQSLLRGVAARFAELGFNTGTFNAFVLSDVLKGGGLSSSASYEVLLGYIFAEFFNGGLPDATILAKIGHYVENEYYGKPSGLMDQMACALGGMRLFDFNNQLSPVLSDLESTALIKSYNLCIVSTGRGHSDLTGEYSSIPQEMRLTAGFFGKTRLAEVPEDDFYVSLPELRKKLPDRALLRAMHFYDEDKRVTKLALAVQAGDIQGFLELIRQSGRSSFELLQNVYPLCDEKERGLSLALALSERILGESGAQRIHGGGFAGTILAVIPKAATLEYKKRMNDVFGLGSCQVLSLRHVGGYTFGITGR